MNSDIQTEINLLSAAKDSLSNALLEKGVEVPNLFSKYGDAIREIQTTKNYVDMNYVDRSVELYSLSIGTKKIRERAFANCKNLASISILSTVEEIGADAFLGCDNLTEVVFQNLWTGSRDFIGINFYADIVDNTREIIDLSAKSDYQVSSSCYYADDNFGNQWRYHVKNRYGTGIALWRTPTNSYASGSNSSVGVIINNSNDVIVPDIMFGRKIDSMGNGYFSRENIQGETAKWKTGLSGNTLKVSYGISKFGSDCFTSCPVSAIEFLKTGNESVPCIRNISIGDKCFYNLTSWNYELPFEFPDGNIQTLPSYLFNYSHIQTIKIPETVHTIGQGAFWNTWIKDIVIPDTVISVYRNAFDNNKQLTSVYVGRNVKYSIDSAYYKPPYFMECSALHDVTFGCKLSTFLGYTDAYEHSYYYLNKAKNCVELHFENSYNTFSQLSTMKGIKDPYSGIPANCAIFAYDGYIPFYSTLSSAVKNNTGGFPITIEFPPSIFDQD